MGLFAPRFEIQCVPRYLADPLAKLIDFLLEQSYVVHDPLLDD
jgi:hypothetical protein